MKKRQQSSAPKKRSIQVGEAVRQALGMMLSDGTIKDPRVGSGSLVTVTDVEMSPDLRYGKAFVSVYPEDETITRDVMQGLQSARGEVKRELAHRLKLRFTPHIDFRVDASLVYAAKIDAILQDIRG